MDESPEIRHPRGLDSLRPPQAADQRHGDPSGAAAERRYAEAWSGRALGTRDRRLLLLGVLVAQGLHDDVAAQLDAGLRTGELTPDELRELAVFLAHYAGWARGAKLNNQVEELIEGFMRN